MFKLPLGTWPGRRKWLSLTQDSREQAGDRIGALLRRRDLGRVRKSKGEPASSE